MTVPGRAVRTEPSLHDQENLYTSMGETWMLSVASLARLCLLPGDLSASCGCACVLHRFKGNHSGSCPHWRHVRQRVNIQWWFIVWSLLLLQKTKQISKNSKDFTRSPIVFTQRNCSKIVKLKHMNFSPGPKPSMVIHGLGCPRLS